MSCEIGVGSQFAIPTWYYQVRFLEMWAVAAQHKKYNDSLSGYNSLKDPHLKSYYCRPEIRRHLLRANIINKENKIVDEISSTKHLQRVERQQKRELYHLLEELVKRNEQLDTGSEAKSTWLGGTGKTLGPVTSQEELIKHARSIFDSRNGESRSVSSKCADQSSGDSEDSSILQRLDRMIRAIKEHEHITAPEYDPLDLRHSMKHNHVNGKASDWKLWSSKSVQDISKKAKSPSLEYQLKSYSSSGHLTRDSRPKSSYGRTKRFLNISYPDLAQSDVNGSPLETMKKSKSCANIASCGEEKKDNSATNEEDIESVDGDSWTDSGPESDHGYSGSRSLSKSSKNEQTGGKFFAYDKKLVKSTTRQKVKMTLRYNGLNGATNRGAKRNVKVFQQVAIGGNSILIYDGYVVAGDVFSFDIRPHPNTSYSIIILVNGIRDMRLNTCCEHKHRPGTKLSHFTFVDVVGGRPCFACQNVSFDSEKANAKKYFDWFAIKAIENSNLLVEPKRNTDLEVEIENSKDDDGENDSVAAESDIKANFLLEKDDDDDDSEWAKTNVEPPKVEKEIHVAFEELQAETEENNHKADDNEMVGDCAIELIEEEEDSDSGPQPIDTQLIQAIQEIPRLPENESDQWEQSECSQGESISNSSSLTGLTVMPNEIAEDDSMNLMIDHKDYITDETLPEMDHLDSDSESESPPVPTLSA